MSVDNITRPFTSIPIGLPTRDGCPSHLLLGFPVLWGCPAKTHNTLHAAREYPVGQRCVCPQAVLRLREHRAKDKAARRAKAAAVKDAPPQERRGPKPVLSAGASDHERPREVPDFTRTVGREEEAKDRTPSCRLATLGGTQPAWLVDSLFYTDEARGSQALAYQAQAKAICGGCPIQFECLEAALKNREPYGVWGGTTPDERQAMLRRGGVTA